MECAPLRGGYAHSGGGGAFGLSSLRRPHLGGSGGCGAAATATSSAAGGGGGGGAATAAAVAAYARRCRRVLLPPPSFDDDEDGEEEEEEGGKGRRDVPPPEDVGPTDGGGGGGDPTMGQCVSLLAPHLAAFRDRCGRGTRATGSAAAAGNGGGDGGGDEVPPQLLRVARFFRWRWGPLKRALLRPACSDDDDDDEDGGDEIRIEVGSAWRLRLARALHSRGLLAVAEVDGLAASFDGRRRRRRLRKREFPACRRGDGGGDDGAGSPRKRQRKSSSSPSLDGDDDENDHDDDEYDDDNEDDDAEGGLPSRVRMALSRLPTDAAGPASAGRRGVRHAEAVLDECRALWRGQQLGGDAGADADEVGGGGGGAAGGGAAAGQGKGGGGTTGGSAAGVARPTPDEVADWALTAFAGVVLTSGIDGGGRGGAGRRRSAARVRPCGRGRDRGDDPESSVAAMLLDEVSPGRGDGGDGDDDGHGGGDRAAATTTARRRRRRREFGELGTAVRRRVEELTSPPLVDALSGLHLLTLARWFRCLEDDVVVEHLAGSSARCAAAGGGAGLTTLPKLMAAYLSLGCDDDGDGTALGGAASAVEVGIRRRVQDRDGLLGTSGVGLCDGGWGRRRDLDEASMVKTLEFLDVVLRAARFLLFSP